MNYIWQKMIYIFKFHVLHVPGLFSYVKLTKNRQFAIIDQRLGQIGNAKFALISCINPIVSCESFLYPPENIRKPYCFPIFQGVEKGCIGKKWVNQYQLGSLSNSYIQWHNLYHYIKY